MPPIEWLLIATLFGLILGLILGFLLGARVTRSHYLYIVGMQQQRQAPLQHRPRTRHLRRDEEDYY